MKILLIFLTIFAFSACAKKEWTKESLMEKCNEDFKKRNDISELFTPAQLVLLCDCVAGKMFDNYKSEKEANMDTLGSKQIGSDCAQQIMQ
jgi:hypothetical protein